MRKCRYTLTITYFNGKKIVEHSRTIGDFDQYNDLINEKVKKASIKDNASKKVIWLKK